MKTPPESFIHQLWMKKLVPAIGLQTVSGKKIEILKYGELNTIGGPDIFNSQIKIGETIWAGNIEIHINSSDWNRHNHHNDPAYDSVILHVVYNHDHQVQVQNAELETLELPKELCHRYYDKFEQKLQIRTDDYLPCSGLLDQVPDFILENWKTNLISERIEKKLEAHNSNLDIYNFCWSFMMKSFGMKYNQDPMMLISESIDFRELKSKKKSEIDNTFLRLSGLDLPISVNAFNNLQVEILSFVKPKVKPNWNFGGIRPNNQPIIKLMQFSSFFFLGKNKVIDLIIEGDFRSIRFLMKDVQVHSYWETHSSFHKKCKPRKLVLGDVFWNHMMLNAFLPLYFHLNAKLHGKDVTDKLFEQFESLPKEKNRITTKMMDNGFSNNNGFDSQSLIQLYNCYCQAKKCLNCAVGNKIIS